MTKIKTNVIIVSLNLEVHAINVLTQVVLLAVMVFLIQALYVYLVHK